MHGLLFCFLSVCLCLCLSVSLSLCLCLCLSVSLRPDITAMVDWAYNANLLTYSLFLSLDSIKHISLLA